MVSIYVRAKTLNEKVKKGNRTRVTTAHSFSSDASFCLPVYIYTIMSMSLLMKSCCLTRFTAIAKCIC